MAARAVIHNVIFTGVWVRVCVEIGVARSPPRILERGRGKWIDRSIDRRISISYASAPVIFSVRRKCQAVMKNLPRDDQTGPSFRPFPFFIVLFPRRVLAAYTTADQRTDRVAFTTSRPRCAFLPHRYNASRHFNRPPRHPLFYFSRRNFPFVVREQPGEFPSRYYSRV